MFVPMPLTTIPTIAPHYYNKYEKLDPESVANQFVATEGTYKAIDEIQVAYPAPHPTELAPNPNPLTPHAAPLHSGMHLSVIDLSVKPGTKALRTPSMGDSFQASAYRSEEEKASHEEDGSSSSSTSSTDGDSAEHIAVSSPVTPGLASGEIFRSTSSSTGGADLTASMTATSSIFDGVYDPNSKRKKRIGTSANGTTSTFVSRAIVDGNITARLADHKREEVFVFANINRCLSWFDMGAPSLVKHEPLSKLMLSLATVVSHDVNQYTSTIKGFDVVLGTTTGDLCCFDALTTRYLRYNKQRCINPTAVTQVQWLPGSECLFMASHADGALLIYDKEREDADFFASVSQSGEGEYFPRQESSAAVSVLRSAHDTRSRTNPVSCVALSRQAINAFAFSPDNIHLAVVSDDGCLKVLDYRQERLLDVYSSYYGGLTCVSWSPDGQYIVTGGKDDLVTIWSFTERRIVARCHGHSSFITGVYFDEYKCDEYAYRIGSVSEDGKICLWDFALSSLHRPSSKSAKHAAISGTVDEGLAIVPTGRPIIAGLEMTSPATVPATTNGHSTPDGTPGASGKSAVAVTMKDGTAYHRVASRLSTAILSPITVAKVDDQAPTHLVFLKDRLLIATTGKKYGRIKTWMRP
ncbi:Catabolite repression protein creC [Taphrina deformans PYCC 5710]|uniref:Catabolite repression protein creC n=1 Tax=Taphrina deformans (strain PYCC 5710 / ATCC 11124 / CBS 356.35 / IMI 108563 / JCM 9778 / NBRC 8474) TaxID=1097556 RepID=R4XAV5_TAPDE|nr:Catabolite repression protein creC [Taphrina deformans PYCC 5710]|eukprot:CCG82679.1 Catabolite repression protein creC [Taphrina deformans PYCC 5710]